MASDFNDILDIELHFYVNPVTGRVEDIFSFSPFGMFIRKNSDWDSATRDNSKIVHYTNNYKDYNFVWESDVLLSEDLDLDDPQSWEPVLIQRWDKGEVLTEGDIAPFTKLVE